MKMWSTYYNRERPHMALGPGVPDPPRGVPAPLRPHRHGEPRAERRGDTRGLSRARLEPGSCSGRKAHGADEGQAHSGLRLLLFSLKSISVYLALSGGPAAERMIHEAFRETLADVEARVETRVRGAVEGGNQRDEWQIRGDWQRQKLGTCSRRRRDHSSDAVGA